MQSVLPPSTLGNSVWHRMDARWKLVAVLMALLVIPWLTTWHSALLANVLSFALLLSARLPFTWWRDRLLTVAVFLLLVVIVLPLTMSEPYWNVWGVSISQKGTTLAVTMVLKALAAVCLTLFLTGTTSMEVLLHASTKLGLPQPVLRVMVVAWRYVRVMYETIDHFRIALRLRGFRNRVHWQTYHTIANVVGTLFVLGFDHTEHVIHAMQARGYHGKIETLQHFQTTGKDIFYFSFILMGIALLIGVNIIG